MLYFNRSIKRDQTPSIKYQTEKQLEFFNKDKLLPLWLNDMDFMTSPEIIANLKKRVSKGHFGYEHRTKNMLHAFKKWYLDKHNFYIPEDFIHFSPSISTALPVLIEILTDKDDYIIIQPPVYQMFAKSIKTLDRQVIENPLRYESGRYEMDLNHLESLLTNPKSKVLILSNPHNPVGRVWTEIELRKVADLCIKHNVKIISDEVHRDILYKDISMTNMMDLSAKISKNTITLLAPGKTFNISGQSMAVVLINNSLISKKYKSFVDKYHINNNNILNNIAFETAYTHGYNWLSHFSKVLETNYMILENFINKELPEINIIKPEGTFMVWLDLREISTDSNYLIEAIAKYGDLAVDAGSWFGHQGAGFIRINIACPKIVLMTALSKLKIAITIIQAIHQ